MITNIMLFLWIAFVHLLHAATQDVQPANKVPINFGRNDKETRRN